MIGTTIYSALSNAEAITAIVGTRIYPVVMPQEEKGVSIVYSIGSNNPDQTKDGPSTLETYFFEIYCVSKRYTEVDALASLVRSTLEAYTSTAVQTIRYQSEADDFEFETRSYLRIIQFKIRIKR